MNRGSWLRKCLSLVMAIAILTSIMAPVSVAAAGQEKSGYLALGDAMTDGIGLSKDEQHTKSYAVKVAQYLYGADWEDKYSLVAEEGYRIEELRYLLDKDYNGDGYTEALLDGANGVEMEKQKKYNTVRDQVAAAEYISICVGTDNFATYVVQQLMYYLENDGKVRFDYDMAALINEYNYSKVTEADVGKTLENMKSLVMNELLAASPSDEMDAALELIEFVSEVTTYAVLSYITSFNAVIEEIEKLNPSAKVFVLGVYNPAQGEILSVNIGSRYMDANIGRYFGAVVEVVNAYIQILAPRVYNYTYVDPANPQLLIDVVGDTSLSDEERIPAALRLALLDATEDTAVSLIQEMFETYGISKSEDEAYDIAADLFEATTPEKRMQIIYEQIDGLAADQVLEKFEAELENYAGTYGEIDIETQDILDLLTDLRNAADDDGRELVAIAFVEDLMTKAMIGQTFAGIKIETQEDAYEAIELLKNNSNGDPNAMREAAAQMVIDEIGEDNALGIDRDDVVELLELMDIQTSTEARENVVDAWLTEKAVEYITTTVQKHVPGYQTSDAESLLAQMEASSTDDDSVIAKDHLLTHFTPVLAQTMEEKYTEAGFTLQTFPSFEAFATAINTAADENAVKALVRAEIRAAAAEKIYAYAVTPNAEFLNTAPWPACTCPGQNHDPHSACEGVTEAMVLEMLVSMDAQTDAAAKDAALHQWLVTNWNNGVEPTGSLMTRIFNALKASFQDAYNSYNGAATVAEDMCANYHSSVNKAAEAFGSYADLKQQAADTIIEKYESSYKGAGETAQKYYIDYLNLRNAAVDKVMNGYADYENAMGKGEDACEQLDDKFEDVFDLLREIAEVETISLNDLLAVGRKVINNGAINGSYISEMKENLMQGDSLAKEDKTVAYLALRYYLGGSLMIMPSLKGHETIAKQIIKGINGEPTYSTGGYYANKIIDKTIDIYRNAKAYRDLNISESGQVNPVINPHNYVAFGDNITTGSALDAGDKTYAQLVAEALAMAADDRDGADYLNNYAINGMRVEELLMLVDATYAGDEYTADRFGTAEMEALRAQYLQNITEAELITLNVGINNLTTYPITQTLLAYNGQDTYEMDWARFIGQSRFDKIEAGKEEAINLILRIVDSAESRANIDLEGISAYQRAETALLTSITAIESVVYGLVSYIFTLDDAVEKIATINEDATIVLVGFYNPLEDTYFRVDRTVNIRSKSIDLSQYEINTSAVADIVINLANRYLANYVGNVKADATAAGKDSRLLNVVINDAELFVTADSSVSKDLSTLGDWTTITIKGHDLTIKLPEYLLAARKTRGDALHPNAAGHQYIADQILKALDFEIYADVYTEDYTKVYGDEDPDFEALIDDLSSLWNIEITDITRDAGEEVGVYNLYVQYNAENGYTEIDEEFGTLTITKRTAKITVTVKDGAITAVAYDNVVEADKALLEASDLTLTGTTGSYVVTSSDAYIAKNYDLTIVVEEEDAPITLGTIEMVGPSLNLESEVHYNFNFRLNGFDMSQVSEIGLLSFYTRADDAADSNIFTADAITPGVEWDDENDCYRVRSEGIPAKNLGDDRWFRVYVRMVDGQIAYGARQKFSASIYTVTALNGTKYSNELKALCVTLMNYGSAAQEYFAALPDYDYSYEVLMKSVIDDAKYDVYKAMVEDYADTMIDTRLPADAVKYGEFATQDKNVFNSGYKAHLTLLGDIALNVTVDYTGATASESGMLIWSENTFHAVDTLTWANADQNIVTTPDGCIDITYKSIAAKNTGDTVFLCGYVLIDGEYSYTSVFRLSVDYYAQKIIDKGNADEMEALAKYLVVYGEYAKEYFNKKNGG